MSSPGEGMARVPRHPSPTPHSRCRIPETLDPQLVRTTDADPRYSEGPAQSKGVLSAPPTLGEVFARVDDPQSRGRQPARPSPDSPRLRQCSMSARRSPSSGTPGERQESKLLMCRRLEPTAREERQRRCDRTTDGRTLAALDQLQGIVLAYLSARSTANTSSHRTRSSR